MGTLVTTVQRAFCLRYHVGVGIDLLFMMFGDGGKTRQVLDKGIVLQHLNDNLYVSLIHSVLGES